MTNSVDPDQTAPIGAVCSGSTLFASILIRQLFAAGDFNRRHFQMYFFLGALRVNEKVPPDAILMEIIRKTSACSHFILSSSNQSMYL